MNAIHILLTLVSAAPQFLQLLTAIIGEVHAVQAAMPGAPGAEKSAAVLAKVTPIADLAGAEVPHVQSLINQAVDMSKQFKVGAFADAGA